MPSREAVLDVLGDGRSYEEAAQRLGIRPGLVHLIATGLPADGSDAPSPGDAQHRRLPSASTQHLSNPRTSVPQRDETVEEWMRGRARADRPMQVADDAWSVEPPARRGEDSMDVIALLGWDHARLRYLVQEVQTIPGEAAEQTPTDRRRLHSVLTMLSGLLHEHEAAEQEAFWPAVIAEIGGGDDFASLAREQEDKAARLLEDATGSDGEPPPDELLADIIDAIRKHLATEDTVMLRVAQELSETRRTEIGRAVQDARRAVA